MIRTACAIVVVAACASHQHAAVDAPIADLAVADAVPLVWLSVTPVTQSNPAIVVENVTYQSGAFVVAGQVCRPNDGARHPIFSDQHGGFAGLDGDADAGLCPALAAMGYVFLEASYRGEDSSQGAVEVCLGEVDDMMRMIAVAQAQPYADASRVGVLGASHGGCITLRALERGVPAVVAADGFGITDMADSYAYWQQQLATDPTGMYAAVQQSLVTQLDTATGGAPAAFPAEYSKRSPDAFTAMMPASLPLMIAHGTIDPLVSVTSSCTFAAQLGGFTAYHLDATQTVVTTVPTGCEAANLVWQAGPLPTTWGSGRYLLIYDGVGHEFTSVGGQAMALQLVEFVTGKLQ